MLSKQVKSQLNAFKAGKILKDMQQIMSFISTALPRITATWPQQSLGEKIERQVGLFGPKGFLKDKPKNKSVGLIFWPKRTQTQIQVSCKL